MAARKKPRKKATPTENVIDEIVGAVPGMLGAAVLKKITGLRASSPIVVFMTAEDLEARVRTIVLDELAKARRGVL